MMVTVPANPRQLPEPTVPPPGWYRASIQSVQATEDEVALRWRFNEGDKVWTLPQEMDLEEFGHMLGRIGVSPGEVDIDDTVGTRAAIEVATRGGRKTARVRQVVALETVTIPSRSSKPAPEEAAP